MISYFYALVGFQKQFSQCEIECNLFISISLFFISLCDIIKYIYTFTVTLTTDKCKN